MRLKASALSDFMVTISIKILHRIVISGHHYGHLVNAP